MLPVLFRRKLRLIITMDGITNYYRGLYHILTMGITTDITITATTIGTGAGLSASMGVQGIIAIGKRIVRGALRSSFAPQPHLACPLNTTAKHGAAAFKASLVGRGGTASLAHVELQKDPQLCREPEPPRAWPGFALETR